MAYYNDIDNPAPPQEGVYWCAKCERWNEDCTCEEEQSTEEGGEKGMSVHELKDIVDLVVEELHSRGILTENQYGKLSATLGEEIAETLIEKVNS